MTVHHTSQMKSFSKFIKYQHLFLFHSEAYRCLKEYKKFFFFNQASSALFSYKLHNDIIQRHRLYTREGTTGIMREYLISRDIEEELTPDF